MEWGKVTKPTWDEVQGRTGVVLVGTGVLAIFLWLVDIVIGQLIRLFLNT